MISIHIVSLIVGLIVGFISGGVMSILVDKSTFFDERYWAGWGKGYDACRNFKENKDKKDEIKS